MKFYPTNEVREATILVCDLRDPAQWREADVIRRAWPREQREVHRLDEDHIALVLKSGGALEDSA